MRLTLDQLRVFVAVAERQHVTRAAETLNLTQSAASAAIAALEIRNGVRLFDRVGRGIELTGAGRAFLPEAQAVLARAEAAETALTDLAGLGRGTLPVHASQTIAGYWLPRHIVAFRRAYPGISVPLSIGNTAQVASAVQAGTAELGFVEGMVDDPLLIARTVAMDQLVVVVASGHPWATDPPADLAALLRDGEWVLREPGSGTRSAFEDSLRDAGLDPRSLQVTLELPSNESVRGAVEAGLGATTISASVAAPSIEAGLLHRVPVDLPERAFQVMRHRDRPASRAAEALLALIPAAPALTPRRAAGSNRG